MPWAPFVTNQEEVNRPGQKVLGTRWCLEEKRLIWEVSPLLLYPLWVW